MKITFIMAELRPSGAEMMFKLAAPVWLGQGCDLQMLSMAEKQGPFGPELEEAGFVIHHVSSPSKTNLLQWMRSFHSGLAGLKPHIIHNHCEGASLLVSLVSRTHTRRLFRTVHNSFPYSGAMRIQKILERAVSRALGCRHIAISSSVQANEARRLHNPSELCWNWFDDSRFRPPSRDERCAARSSLGLTASQTALVSVGNGNDVKNYPAIIEALSLLHQNRPTIPNSQPAIHNQPPTIIYAMVGNEHPQRKERQTAEALRLSDAVRFCGPQADVLPYLWAADIFVMPSIYEGFGVAAVEALATGIPCIFSDVPGLRDFKQFPLSITWCGADASSIADAIKSVMGRSGFGSREEKSAAAVRAEFGVERRAGEYLRMWRGGMADR